MVANTEAKEKISAISLLLISPDDTYQTSLAKSSNYQTHVHLANSVIGAVTRAKSLMPDVIVIDLRFEACGLSYLVSMLRSIKPTIPLIFISHPLIHNNIPQLIYYGCDALVEPPLNKERFDFVLSQVCGDEDQLARKPERPTVLPWEEFQAQASKILNQARGNHSPASLCIIAVNNLDELSSMYGKHFKERVIMELTNLASMRFRCTDARGTLKEGVLALMVAGENGATSLSAISSMEDELAASFLSPFGEQPYEISLSVGVADFREDGCTIEALTNCAMQRSHKTMAPKMCEFKLPSIENRRAYLISSTNIKSMIKARVAASV